MPKRVVRWLHGKIKSHYQARYHGKYKYPKHIFAFDAFLMTAVVVLAGFILYFNILWVPGVARQINLEIVAPSELRIGEETKFEIRYANRSKETIYNTVLGLEMPRGFTIESSSPDLGKYNTLHLGTINPGGNGSVLLFLRAIGNPGERQETKVYLTFDRSGSSEQKVTIKAVTLSKPAFDVTANFSKVVTAGEETIFPVDIENTAKLKDAEIKMTLSGDNNFISLDGGALRLGNITGKSSTSFRAVILGSAKEAKLDLKSTVFYQNEEIGNGEQSIPLSVLPPEISVNLSAPAGAGAVSTGESVPLYFKAVNHSSKVMSDAHAEFIDQKNILDHNFAPSGASWNDGKLVFAATKNIAKGEAWEFSFKVKTKDEYPEISGVMRKNISLTILPMVSFSAANKKVYGSPLDLKFKSVLTLKTFALYFGPGGDPLGRGPLPPEVGKETRLWIFVNAVNTFNDLTGVNFSAHLADGVEFTGVTTVFYGDKIGYNQDSREVRWPLGLVPAYAGAGAEMPAAGFEVKFIPREADRGKTLTLLDSASLSGQDDYTGEQINIGLPALKTTFEFDEMAAGKGIVQ